MKKRHLLFLVLLVLLGSLNSCRKDVDMNNIDPHIQAEMGVALPIGNMFYRAGDFLGGGSIKNIYVGENGIFHFIDTLDMPKKEFHAMNLSDYLGENTKDFGVFDQLKAQGIITDGGNVVGFGIPIRLKFSMTLKMQGMNGDVDNERLDSVQVTDAVFTSVINKKGFDMKWTWVDHVDVVLNKQFRRPQGDTVRVYTRGDGYDNFGDTIPITIDEFTVSMMKDLSAEPGRTNVIDSCSFTFLFNFTIPSTAGTVNIGKNAAFNYYFAAQFIDFKAAWGYFRASNQMRDRSKVSIDSMWGGWANVKQMKMRFMEPEITVYSSHHVAAPLRMYVDTLMAVSQNTKVFATWNSSNRTDFLLDNVVSPYGSLEDSVWNVKLFNYEEGNGRLDKLFDIRPDSLIYSYHLRVDDGHPDYNWKQHRITPNTTVIGKAVTDMPFKFNDGSEMNVVTKMENVQFNRLKLDSLLNSEAIEKSRAKHIMLYMFLRNSMPFEVNTKIDFLRQDSSVMKLKLVKGNEENRILLPAPKMAYQSSNEYGYVTEPSETTLIVDVDEQQFDSLVQCKHLRIDAYLGKNPAACVLDTNTNIKVQLGLAADVEAILNLNKKNTK